MTAEFDHEGKTPPSLDGSGIRGLVSSLWLRAAEDALARAENPGLRKNFDLMAKRT